MPAYHSYERWEMQLVVVRCPLQELNIVNITDEIVYIVFQCLQVALHGCFFTIRLSRDIVIARIITETIYWTIV